MSKYKYFRPYRRRRSYFTFTGIFFTLLIWSAILAADIIKLTFKYTIKLCRWIRNTYHFRNINYSHDEIVNLIRNMSPREFEIFIAEMFKAVGYEVELTPETCDGGVDVKIWDNEGRLIYIEAKHFAPNNYVGRVILQKAYGSAMINKADECVIITTGQFHQNAIDESIKVNNLTLMDLNDILALLKKIDVHVLPRIFVKTFNSEPKESNFAFEY